jgi:hypothetical protein
MSLTAVNLTKPNHLVSIVSNRYFDFVWQNIPFTGRGGMAVAPAAVGHRKVCKHVGRVWPCAKGTTTYVRHPVHMMKYLLLLVLDTFFEIRKLAFNLLLAAPNSTQSFSSSHHSQVKRQRCRAMSTLGRFQRACLLSG